jgi:hypothetical protein
MIVHNFDIPSGRIPPLETDPPLLINPDAILAATIAAQFFQLIERWAS